ncbi:MAG TPA: asparagine synthase (glutamine-hydrolyzing) [Proteobacteria bacterium]|nr:asparagine synthase (glutamine-hydrolyzing) [Pseudomonadota bacterium]
MCGIIGQFFQKGRCNPEILRIMRDSMVHRGPDDAGEWYSPDSRVGFAHRRLAIIDLSPAGHQPMLDERGRFCIVFNGEIYNFQYLRCELEGKGHIFRSESDTEVILSSYREWGIDCLQRFNGMFAFSLFDSEARRLLLARNRAGEKPLYYWHSNGKFVFASELKALMADPAFPRILNNQALDYYLAYGYVPGNMCILKGVKKLEAGHALEYDFEKDEVCSWRYWRLPEPNAANKGDVDDFSYELEELLKDSVKRQLVADVPVGVMLSGGLDSSLITAMAVATSPRRIRTFNVSFRGHDGFDESEHARLIAEFFGTQHEELLAEPASVTLLPEIAKQFDEPIADHAIVPTYILSREIRKHAKVALSGDGGDELFGGYSHYNWILKQENLRRYIPNSLRRCIARVASDYLPLGMRGRNHLIGLSDNHKNTVSHINLYFDHLSRKRLYSPDIRFDDNDLTSECYRSSMSDLTYSLLRQGMEADFRTTLTDGYLVKVDRASMLASLEVRAPLLDYRIIEFAYGRLPDHLKVTKNARKILLRHLAKRLLPKEYDVTRKQGFTMPLHAWFKGDWGAYMESVLTNSDGNLFSNRFIQDLLSLQKKGYANTNRIFALTMFELWRQEYKIQVEK